MAAINCQFEFFMRLLKVRQSRNAFFKPTILPKNERTNSVILPKSTMTELFCSFFGRIMQNTVLIMNRLQLRQGLQRNHSLEGVIKTSIQFRESPYFLDCIFRVVRLQGNISFKVNWKNNSPFVDLYGCQKDKREKISHPFPFLLYFYTRRRLV